MNLTQQERLNARILIVDDQPANVALLEAMLQDAGYTRVSSTMEPEQVCAMHRKAPFDLILLDLQMPGMDGFQVMEGLKASTAEDDYLPVLVITAQPGHKLRALQAGAKDFISKPFDLVEVRTRIHNMLEVRLLYRRLEAQNAGLERRVDERTAEQPGDHRLGHGFVLQAGVHGGIVQGVGYPNPNKDATEPSIRYRCVGEKSHDHRTGIQESHATGLQPHPADGRGFRGPRNPALALPQTGSWPGRREVRAVRRSFRRVAAIGSAVPRAASR